MTLPYPVERSAKLGDACLRDIPRLVTQDELRHLSRIDSTQFTLAALIEFALIAAAVAVSERWWNPAIYGLTVVVIGSRINSLGGLMHEAAHRRAYRSRLLNDLVGEIVALPTTASMTGYRNSHFRHHRELNSDDDPDWTRNLGLEEFQFPAGRRAMLRRFLAYLLGLKIKAALVGFHRNKETRDVPAMVRRGRATFLGCLVATSIAFEFWTLLLLYWMVPLLTVFLAVRYLRIVAEHYAIEHQHVLNESRTVIAPFWERWLIAPWGLNYHLEHHLFPSVPCFRLAELHRLLMTRDPYSQIAHVTHGYLDGLLRDCSMNTDPLGAATRARDPATPSPGDT